MIVICRALSVCSILLLASCSDTHDENPTEPLERNADEECQHCNVSFWVTKLTRTHIEGTLERFKLTADKLIKRQRQGRFMQFINYDELYIKVLTIDQHLNTKIVKFDMNEIIPLTSNDTVALTSFDDNTRVSNNVVKQTESKVLGNTLSRVLVDEVKINFKPPKYQPVVLTANHAKMLTDTMIMQFEGNVTLEAAKCKISSEVAIWSNKYNGLFFSEAYQFNDKTYETPAFFQITDTGRCKRKRPVRVLEYDDKLDAIEDKLLASMPMSARLMFGLMGAPANQNGLAQTLPP